MKYAILADIHGNLEALESVLADIKSQNVPHIACLGDIVGYGPNPQECVAIVRALNIPSVKGNHDEYCSREEPPAGFNPPAAKAVQWTRKQLTDEDRRWLRDLEYSLIIENFTMVHGSLDAPPRWNYVFDKMAAAASFPNQNTQVGFFGHTHVPVAFMRDEAGVRGGSYARFALTPEKKYFVNPGSVGQPRDNNPRAAYAIYDLEAGTIELRRVDYDFGTTQRKMRLAGL